MSSALLAQTEHLKFKGIPIDGTLEKFSEALIEIGFELNEDSKEDEMLLIGDFAGYKDCRVYVSTLDNIDLVNFVSVAFPDRDTWSSLLRDYTSLKDMLMENTEILPILSKIFITRKPHQILISYLKSELTITITILFSVRIKGK